MKIFFSATFKRSVFISLLGHIAVFSVFSLSFGNNIPKAEYVPVSFWGQLLYNSQVKRPVAIGNNLYSSQSKTKTFTNASTLYKNLAQEFPFVSRCHIKPALDLAFIIEKQVTSRKYQMPLLQIKRNEPAIIFYPLLPYGFPLYFKDRQVAHVELMFKMLPSGLGNPILIKRKISSGNLEVDLLSMRYIEHYLFIRQPSISETEWQTVKIDLSAGDR